MKFHITVPHNTDSQTREFIATLVHHKYPQLALVTVGDQPAHAHCAFELERGETENVDLMIDIIEESGRILEEVKKFNEHVMSEITQ